MVRYNIRGNGSTAETGDLESGARLKSASKAGYTFAGWEIVKITKDDKTIVTENGQSYGGWTIGAVVNATTELVGKFGSVELKATYTAKSFSIKFTLANMTTVGDIKSTTVTAGQAYEIGFNANTAYVLPETITVTRKVDGKTVYEAFTNFTYDKANGLVIDAQYMIGDFEVTANGVAIEYTITYNKNGVSFSITRKTNIKRKHVLKNYIPLDVV